MNLRLKEFPKSCRTVDLAMAWFLGVVLFFSAISKLIDLNPFEAYLLQQHLFPNHLIASIAARLLIAAELFLGLSCFVKSGFRRFTLPGVFLMLTIFSTYLAYQVISGSKESCHCFGEVLQLSPANSLIKNLALMVIVLALMRRTTGWPGGTWRCPVILGSLCILTIFLGFPIRHQPQPPVGTLNFAQFKDFNDGYPADLTNGECLVAFLSLECNECARLATQIGLAMQVGQLPPTYAICLGSTNEIGPFLEKTRAQFPYLIASPETFLPFIGSRPPRLYLLTNGKVVKYWDSDNFTPSQLNSK